MKRFKIKIEKVEKYDRTYFVAYVLVLKKLLGFSWYETNPVSSMDNSGNFLSKDYADLFGYNEYPTQEKAEEGAIAWQQWYITEEEKGKFRTRITTVKKE